MTWKSYRGHAQPTESSPYGAVAVAVCIVLILAVPWLLISLGLITVWHLFVS
jgi:hypothetical protein